jgi:uncharacterized LabA/DUF88 family protein
MTPEHREIAPRRSRQTHNGKAIGSGHADFVILRSPRAVWSVRPRENLSLTKNTFDIALAVDAMELACQTPPPTVVVIESGEADFMQLIVRLREREIRMICVFQRTEMAQEVARTYDKVSR